MAPLPILLGSELGLLTNAMFMPHNQIPVLSYYYTCITTCCQEVALYDPKRNN